MRDTKNQLVVQRLCRYCPHAKECDRATKPCNEYKIITQGKTRLYKALKPQEKQEIYNYRESGEWYDKEICLMFNITQHTLRKVVYAIKVFYETGKTEQL